jgi:hypothetical protein
MSDHTTGYIPPIRSTGSNSLEARIKALEVAQGYDIRDMEDLWHELETAHKRISDLSGKIDGAQQKAALWAISALVSAVAALALIVVKIKAPWIFTP